MEGIPCGGGHGCPEKESQQEAPKPMFQRSRRKPQFIDEAFAAKANRTKMEEESALNVPETSQDMNFTEGSGPKVEKYENPFQTEVLDERSSVADEVKEKLTDSSVEEEKKANDEDSDLSDTSHSKFIDREATIAAAEAEVLEN